ncbi:MAG: nucleotidyltransferase family protein [Novosphingobium sp.]|nr:nucleotidyltransferase family protein [Novosphingobium sp.]
MSWLDDANEKLMRLVETRISDHGIAALLYENRQKLIGWPHDIFDFLRREALGQAMWEARHKAVLSGLLNAMAHTGIRAILLKGTALAYLAYANPASRKRGDTDLLVQVSDRNDGRSILSECGFFPIEAAHSLDGEQRLQEVWAHDAEDGSRHFIDLHWQVTNSPSLEGILRFSDISANLQPLPRLSPNAQAPDSVSLMIHACVHRAGHKVSPYFVDGRRLIEGDRLIWLFDLHLLAQAFSDDHWSDLVKRCSQLKIGPVCHEGLLAARTRFHTDVPFEVLQSLIADSSVSVATDYLMNESPLRRAWLDLRAIKAGQTRLSYLLARIFPPAAFIRSKYPNHAHWPVVLLYARRIASLVFRK